MWRLALKQPYVWLQFFVSKLFGCAILFKKGIVLLVSSNFLGVKIEVKTSLKVCRIKQRPVVTQTVTVLPNSWLRSRDQHYNIVDKVEITSLELAAPSCMDKHLHLKTLDTIGNCPTSLLT